MSEALRTQSVVLKWENGAQNRSDYAFDALDAFQNQLRADGTALACAHVDRLYREASPFLSGGTASTAPELPATTSAAQSLVAKSVRFLRLLPAFFAQKKRMDRDLGVPGPAVLALGIASGRLLAANPASLRKYLARISQTFPVSKPLPAPFSDQIDSDRPVFLCEPIAESPFWAQREKVWNEQIYLVDGFFLFFLALLSPFRSLPAIFSRTLRGRTRTSASRKQLVFFALFEQGFERVFRYPREVSGLFYTCNSFLTEVLRWTLLEMPTCTTVHELLHGIPTSNVEAYFASLLKAKGNAVAARKHFFVPQIPGFADFGVFSGQSIAEGGVAINAYLRGQFVEEGFLAKAHRALVSHPSYAPGKAVIVFIGGHGDPQVLSRMFEIECLMMKTIKDWMEKLGRPQITIYSPHPSFDERRVQKTDFFKSNGVFYGAKTISSLFMADAAMTLYSSAVFEAKYFGVSGFLPVLKSDGFFPRQVLQKAHHQEAEEICFLDSLRRFLTEGTASPTTDLVARINARVAELGEAGISPSNCGT